ncbi:hypothetical protein HDU81_007590 [Chytriomyces hyalinus]|nr:hypothetical protein HDU81_007590 [Chytriomyces hyalinus]
MQIFTTIAAVATAVSATQVVRDYTPAPVYEKVAPAAAKPADEYKPAAVAITSAAPIAANDYAVKSEVKAAVADYKPEAAVSSAAPAAAVPTAAYNANEYIPKAATSSVAPAVATPTTCTTAVSVAAVAPAVKTPECTSSLAVAAAVPTGYVAPPVVSVAPAANGASAYVAPANNVPAYAATAARTGILASGAEVALIGLATAALTSLLL